VSSRAAFTLLELIAVLAILSILAAFLVTQLGTAEEVVQEKLQRAKLSEVALAISHYESEEGDFPLSSLAQSQGTLPNAINVGAELLVMALWSGGLDGCGLSTDALDNTDGDRFARPVGDLETRELFELVDAWGNPIAYFHHADYGREDVYTTFDAATGDPVESQVRAIRNAKTKLYHEHRGFQLVSAGSDGRFGTDDDITSFRR
jgi:prepilin-type N-terminal cleavage/methylation domain-containing protein